MVKETLPVCVCKGEKKKEKVEVRKVFITIPPHYIPVEEWERKQREKIGELEEELEELNRKECKTEADKARIFLLSKKIEELETLLKTIKSGKVERVIITPDGIKAWYLEDPPKKELEKIGTFIDEKNNLIQLYLWKPPGVFVEVLPKFSRNFQITYMGKVPRLALDRVVWEMASVVFAVFISVILLHFLFGMPILDILNGLAKLVVLVGVLITAILVLDEAERKKRERLMQED